MEKLFFTGFFFCLSCVFLFSEQPVKTNQEEIDFFNIYNLTMFRSQEKLTLMHKKGNIPKLGKETIKGDLSGTLMYHAKIKGFGGDVKMIYKNYSDYGNIIINGETNTTAKMNMRGHMYGTAKITDRKGNLLATIKYDELQIIHGVDGGGGYWVQLAGKESEFVGWNEIDRPDREEEIIEGEDDSE